MHVHIRNIIYYKLLTYFNMTEYQKVPATLLKFLLVLFYF